MYLAVDWRKTRLGRSSGAVGSVEGVLNCLLVMDRRGMKEKSEVDRWT